MSRGSVKSSKSNKRQSLYSIEFSPPVDNIRSRSDDDYDVAGGGDPRMEPSLSPKPMTPRRVKRRSVMTRGTTHRQSTNSRRSHSNTRSSGRSSRRKFQQNPVTKIIDQQQQQQQSGPPPNRYPTFKRNENPTLTETNLKYLNKDNATTTSSMKSYPKSNMNSFQPASPPDPIYYNMDSSSALIQQHHHHHHMQQLQQQQQQQNTLPLHQGHYNLTYQHSNPNLAHSPPESTDDLYNNRPPSVRSSYSNFHGARHLSSYNPAPDAENVFAGLNGQHQHQQKQQHQITQQSQQKTNEQAIPQVPQRRVGSRESVRSMAFLNNGPPAYNLNYHTPPDSETTM